MTGAYKGAQMCLTYTTRSVFQTKLNQVHTLKLIAVEISFSILDIGSFLSSARVPGKLPEMSPKFQQVYQFLIIWMKLLLSNTFSLSLSPFFFFVQLHFKNPGCAGCEQREKMLLKVLLVLSQIL